MSAEWVKQQYSDEQIAQVAGGQAGVYPSKQLDSYGDPKQWRWFFAPAMVSGECLSEAAAKAAALSALVDARKVEWANFGAFWQAAVERNQIAVVDGLVLQVQYVSGGRTASPTVSNDQHGGWDWSVARDGVRVADGWCKEIDAAKAAAEGAVFSVKDAR